MIVMDEEHFFSSRNLQEGVDEVHKELKDPVERSETRDVDVDVTDVADGKVRQLESAPIGDVHLDDICYGIFPKLQGANLVKFMELHIRYVHQPRHQCRFQSLQYLLLSQQTPTK